MNRRTDFLRIVKQNAACHFIWNGTHFIKFNLILHKNYIKFDFRILLIKV